MDSPTNFYGIYQLVKAYQNRGVEIANIDPLSTFF